MTRGDWRSVGRGAVVGRKAADVHTALRTPDDLLGLRIAFLRRGMLCLETPGEDDLLNFVRMWGEVVAEAGGLLYCD